MGGSQSRSDTQTRLRSDWAYEAQQPLSGASTERLGVGRGEDSNSLLAGHSVGAINNQGQKCSAVFQASGLHTFGPTAGSSWAGADSGILTILTVYSLMNGATLHVMPHLFQQAGLLVGVVVTGVIGAISCYTCGLIVQIGAYSTEEQDFSDCVAVFFEDASERLWVGETGRYMTLLISVAMMIAVCLSYHYVIVSSIGGIVEPLCSSPIVCGQESEGHWFWTIVTSVLLFFLSYLKLKYQIRLCVAGAICFICGMVVTIGMNISDVDWSNLAQFRPIFYYGESLNTLCGVLFVSFFVHNVILPIVKSQRNPRTSDLAISYSAVGLSYILVGCFGALALPGSSDGNTPEPEPEPESRSLAVVVQVAKALHALTFYPLMTVIYRQQLIGGILRGFGVGKEGGGYALTFGTNLLMVGTTATVTGLNPGLQEAEILTILLPVLSYVGAICGVIYSLVLPLTVHIMVVSTHSRFNTGRFFCYGLLLLFGTFCFLLQFLPDLPGEVIWIKPIPPG